MTKVTLLGRLAFVLAVAGCGGGSDSSSADAPLGADDRSTTTTEMTPNSDPPGVETIGSCDVVTSAEVAAAWGGEIVSVEGDDMASGCTFNEMGDMDVPVPAVVITGLALHGATCADFRTEEVGEVSDADEFGDEAWWIWEPDLRSGQLNACGTAHLFDVQVFAAGQADARATAEELMRLVLARTSSR